MNHPVDVGTRLVSVDVEIVGAIRVHERGAAVHIAWLVPGDLVRLAFDGVPLRFRLEGVEYWLERRETLPLEIAHSNQTFARPNGAGAQLPGGPKA